MDLHLSLEDILLYQANMALNLSYLITGCYHYTVKEFEKVYFWLQ